MASSGGTEDQQVDAVALPANVHPRDNGILIPFHSFFYQSSTFMQHVSVNYARVFLAFITYRNAEGGPAGFFNILSNFSQIFGSTLYVAQTLVGDSVAVECCSLRSSKCTIVSYRLQLAFKMPHCMGKTMAYYYFPFLASTREHRCVSIGRLCAYL